MSEEIMNMITARVLQQAQLAARDCLEHGQGWVRFYRDKNGDHHIDHIPLDQITMPLPEDAK